MPTASPRRRLWAVPTPGRDERGTVEHTAPHLPLTPVLVEQVRASILALAERWLGGQADDPTWSWEVRVTGMAPWELVLSPDRCVISPGPAARPDVRFRTDAFTWLSHSGWSGWLCRPMRLTNVS